MTCRFSLHPHQNEVLEKLRSGSILVGGVGSGKSITAIAYYYVKESGGTIPYDGKGYFTEMTDPKDLYIITTAMKRDNLEWDAECARFTLSRKRENSINGVKVTVDSWNNIKKYTDVKDAFFIFDEQRLVGSGVWVKSFLKIVKNNRWILLSATPGDVWMDYIPVFIANGFYKNRTAFSREHIVWNRFTPYPSIDRYIGIPKLEHYRQQVVVIMDYRHQIRRHSKTVFTKYDVKKAERISKDRWNIYTDEPIQNISQVCYLLRRVSNEDPTRIEAVRKLILEHGRTIIFYNFNYELEILRKVTSEIGVPTAEWNGHKHEPIPKTKKWAYLVQYTAGAEGWNCIETNVTIFYSQNYSYKTMIQAAGRIDRLNTPFEDLYYYHLRSTSSIDTSILKVLKGKKNFNARMFVDK